MITRRRSEPQDPVTKATRNERATPLERAAVRRQVDGPVSGAAPQPTWDPYQVWLTRVKQPREQTVRRRQLGKAEGVVAPATDISDTARLRILAATPSR